MLHPFHSLTIPFAIVTGIFLWISSLATGWTANYLALTRMEHAISHSLRIRRRLGTVRANTMAHWVKHHAAGSVGYVVLGFSSAPFPSWSGCLEFPSRSATSLSPQPVSAMLSTRSGWRGPSVLPMSPFLLRVFS